MAKFAEKTTVPVEKTRYEIEQILEKYGADQFLVANDWAKNRVVIQFRCQNRFIRYSLQLPDQVKYRTNAAHAQAVRSTWRAVFNIIKAKLIAIDAEISTFENEFLANVIAPDGRTVAELVLPQLAIAYKTGSMPENVLALPNYSGEK